MSKGSGWKPLPKDPGPGMLQGKVPPIQPILPPGAEVRPKDKPEPSNKNKPITGLEPNPKGKGGSKSAN